MKAKSLDKKFDEGKDIINFPLKEVTKSLKTLIVTDFYSSLSEKLSFFVFS